MTAADKQEAPVTTASVSLFVFLDSVLAKQPGLLSAQPWLPLCVPAATEADCLSVPHLQRSLCLGQLRGECCDGGPCLLYILIGVIHLCV